MFDAWLLVVGGACATRRCEVSYRGGDLRGVGGGGCCCCRTVCARGMCVSLFSRGIPTAAAAAAAASERQKKGEFRRQGARETTTVGRTSGFCVRVCVCVYNNVLVCVSFSEEGGVLRVEYIFTTALQLRERIGKTARRRGRDLAKREKNTFFKRNTHILVIPYSMLNTRLSLSSLSSNGPVVYELS